MKANIFFSIVIIMLPILLTCSGKITEHEEKNKILSDGLCIYRAEITDTNGYMFEVGKLETAKIIGEPIIYYDDILFYDTTSYILNLTYSKDSLYVGLQEPFIVALDSQIIFGGWFWSPIWSMPCYGFIIEPEDLFDLLAPNEIRIKYHYPEEKEFIGVDPRKDYRIIERLLQDGKIK